MPVFYRGQRALITHQVFETIIIGRVRYAIDELADVHIVRADPERDLGNRVLGLSALVAIFLVVPIVGPVSKVATGLVIVALLIGSALSVRRRAPVHWQLVAAYDGRPVTLFESDDRTEFEQICRALQRALEQRAGEW
jgi:Family of unknown function (DUF6232)